MASKLPFPIYDKLLDSGNGDFLALDFESTETVHQWQQLPECDEFVGTRYPHKLLHTYFCTFQYLFSALHSILNVKLSY